MRRHLPKILLAISRLFNLRFLLFSSHVSVSSSTTQPNPISRGKLISDHPIFPLLDQANRLSDLRILHGHAISSGLITDRFAASRLLQFCLRPGAGNLQYSVEIFDSLERPDVYTWNAIIAGHIELGSPDSGVSFYFRLRASTLPPNMYTYALLVKACLVNGWTGDQFHTGRKIHGQVIKAGVEDFLAEGIVPDTVILVSVLKACAHSGALDLGRSIHLNVQRNRNLNGNSNVIFSTALIDMYCKCGCIDEAFEVFNGVCNGDVVIWNAIIRGLAMHGEWHRALGLFDAMKGKGIKPNEATYISVLCACTHAGIVEKGVEIFESMKKDGIEPRREHYGCLADLMGRSGRIQRAQEVLLMMPMEPQAEQWGALMFACRMHGEVNAGLRAGRHLIALEPSDAGRYVMLGNMFADAGRWEEAAVTRSEIEDKGIQKETGCSLV
ncbi:Pentatricopeptide repeat-containing protein [Apostasia shenzhenica]|uniref:Pentatricopeptide repeat-containing protein n=1 Tax=Apostasia shenzhenica TaxID=1088818 RepID=A0A2I0BDW8_9ASPA|nr:Pentatricopeptide repeat-containing protein [Apostasia shenzhenica]